MPRSQSLTGPPRRGSGSLPPFERRKPRGDLHLPQRGAKLPRNSGIVAGEGTRSGQTKTDDAASVAVNAEQVLQIGHWSVRRSADETIGPVFVHMETGQAQWEPPPEVLAELATEESDDENAHEVRDQDGCTSHRSGSGKQSDRDGCTSHRSSSSRPGSASKGGRQALAPLASPTFRRIVLGPKSELPLRMARDILAALREDPSIFDEVQRRFSEVPKEPLLELSKAGASGLPEELDSIAVALRCGELSEVIGTEAGMQILLRVA